ncbi:hypothetical protein SDC9_71943 [bioreactor metagenome]|uniref:Uncharacterized protein n=1 Tax=bioreactor metagenome TaxID=1076179 RepID=A0A644YAW2_9ZZZZ
MSLSHRFNVIGYHFTCGQNIAHTRMSHCNTITGSYGTELNCHTSLCMNTILDTLYHKIQMCMSRTDSVGGVDNPYDWLFKLHLGKPSSFE